MSLHLAISIVVGGMIAVTHGFFAVELVSQRLLFPVAVGLVAIAFGLTTAWMLGRQCAEPVRELQQAAQAVAQGDLQANVKVLRADEFGPLITEFNKMVAGLREGERLRRTFGLHVGREAARQILASDPGLGGVEQCLTIMFVDIRNFTASSSNRSPQEVVSILNEFLTEMVDVVESEHGGMVNKYLGDGFMALFAVGDNRVDRARSRRA